ncbi:unnamed protein product [Pseudo-nitzschia multistriata]|uniref:Uncharacterized protein n=1 Tax=Pseudo-nitzschia multistriata TaxID=183589 RepID=A0A448YYG2_9STRA|nr:unnamed protein product [Pseudo-nitzschia multistriata]
MSSTGPGEQRPQSERAPTQLPTSNVLPCPQNYNACDPTPDPRIATTSTPHQVNNRDVGQNDTCTTEFNDESPLGTTKSVVALMERYHKNAQSKDDDEDSLLQRDPGALHIPSGIHVEHSSKEYTLDDVINSNNEGVDVSEHIRSLEKCPPNQTLSTSSLLPRIHDSFLDNMELNKDQSQDGLEENVGQLFLTDSECRRPEEENSSSNISELTMKLAQLPTVGKMNHHHHTNAFRPSSEDSMTLPTTKKTGADMYYENAAKIFPTRRYSTSSSKSGYNADGSRKNDIEIGTGVGTMNDEGDNEGDPSKKKKLGAKIKMRLQRGLANMGTNTKADIEIFKKIVKPHRKKLLRSFRKIATHIVLPSLFMAVLLFYGFENPPNGVALAPCKDSTDNTNALNKKVKETPSPTPPPPTVAPSNIPSEFPTKTPTPSQFPTKLSEASNLPTTSSPTTSPTRKPTYTFVDKKNETLCTSEEISLKQASVSWWFLFVGVRQVITLCLAVVMQVIVIDFVAFRTRYLPQLMGTELTLAIAQSKGWPCILFFWAIFDMIFLFGKSRFARNWLYYQDYIDLFNANNPSGDIPNNKHYKKIIFFSIPLSAAVTLKRTVMANFVGQRVVGESVYVLE